MHYATIIRDIPDTTNMNILSKSTRVSYPCDSRNSLSGGPGRHRLEYENYASKKYNKTKCDQ